MKKKVRSLTFFQTTTPMTIAATTTSSTATTITAITQPGRPSDEVVGALVAGTVEVDTTPWLAAAPEFRKAERRAAENRGVRAVRRKVIPERKRQE